MRSTIKTTVGAMLAVLALGAVASASASAAPSVTLGSGKTAELAQTATVTENFVMTNEEATSQPQIECSKLKVVGGVLTGGVASFPVKMLKFENCELLGFENQCEVNKGGVIETKELTAEVVNGTKSPDTELVIKPKTGTELFGVKLKNKGAESCEVPQIYGNVTGKITTAEENDSLLATGQKVAFHTTEASNELKGANKPMGLKGAIGLALANAGTFAFSY